MAFNNENNNALDIILKFRTVSQWMRNMYTGLKNYGAIVGHRHSRDNDDTREVDDSREGHKIEKKGAEDSESKEIKESHMVVSILIATVTFAAGFTVPGGYQSEKGPDQGLAVLSRKAAFKSFVISNTLAMSMSSCAVMIRFFLLLRRRQLTFESGPYRVSLSLAMYALIAMVIAFVTGTYAVLDGHSSLGLAIATSVLGCFFFFALGAFLFVPAFATLRGWAGKIAHRITLFIYHFLHGHFLELVPKCKE